MNVLKREEIQQQEANVDGGVGKGGEQVMIRTTGTV
jgi:hypothetical protein